ncbi:hypothetical protein BsWGS_16200 [Bradybaena similaris]
MPQQGYPLGSMDIMDEMTVGGIGNSPQGISDIDRTVDSLGPIFPPQNFEVPDISFSNSVIPNADFNQSLLSSAQVYGSSSNIFTNVGPSAGHAMEGQPVGLHKQQMSGQRQMPYFPPASQSPPGTSSSDDSDDLPLAQLAKRVISSSSSATNVGTATSPSAPSTDTTSMEGSPVSSVGLKKAKQSKKKKKKDPNEPQKPVSAYALFFRDTQATIKGHNPSASFGEVSKVVASMWDQLDPEHKDVYKKKTEIAKKQYLKQLAAYRASQVSQSAADEAAEKSPSPPGVTNMPVGGMTGSGRFQATGGPTQVNIGGQMLIQQRSPPHPALISSPIVQQQQQHQQMQQLQQQQVVMNQVPQPSPPRQQYSPPREVTPMAGPTYKSPPHNSQVVNAVYQHTLVDHNSFGFSGIQAMEVAAPLCVRNGCRNHAKENPAWDSEYCSNDCVITHCRDIFKNWVSSNSYPVK